MEVLRQQPPPEANHYMGYHSLSHFDSFHVDRLDSKIQHFPQKAPPTPPQTMARVSLPSIADILNPSTEDKYPSERQIRYNDVRHNDTHVDERGSQHQQHQPTQYFPPTPPMSTDISRDVNSRHLPALHSVHPSGSASPAFRQDSHPRLDYNSSARPRPQIDTHYPTPRSPDLPTPHPHSASTQSSHPYRRSPEFRSARRSRSPRDTSRSVGKVSSLPFPNGPLSPHSSVKDEPHSSRHHQDYPQRQSAGNHEQLPSLLNSAPSPYPTASSHRSLPPEFPTPAPYISSLPPQQSHQSHSPHSSPTSQRLPNFTRPRSESWSGRQPHATLHQQPQPSSHTVQVSPQLQHTNQPLAQVLCSQPTGSSDRYICSTCGKCFSRPSSLRIHSHSHTGEKPFRCSREGCGKAFSVRSNMKRHERGCHVGVVAPPPGYHPGPMGHVPAPIMPQPKNERLGLGVTGLPSMANGMPPLPRELAPALDTSS